MRMAATVPTVLSTLPRRLAHPALTCCWLVLSLMPLLIAGGYNHPSNDDYSNSIWTDFWSYQRTFYNGWTGRFFSSAVLSLNPIRWGSFTGYRIAADVLILAFAGTYTLAISAALRLFSNLPFRLRLAIGAAATVAVLNSMPSLAEGFYWYTGAMTYTLPLVLLGWAVLAGIRLHRESARPNRTIWSAQGLLIFAATACNEVSLLLPGLACTILAIHYRRTGNSGMSRHYAVLLPFWALSAAISLCAPGNFARQATTGRDLSKAVPAWIMYSRALLQEWISDPAILAVSVAMIAIFAARNRGIRLHAAFLLALSAGLIVLLLMPGFLAEGKVPAYRIRNLCLMIFLPAWLLAMAALGQRLQNLMARKGSLRERFRMPLAVTAGILVVSQFGTDRLRRSSNYIQLANNFNDGILRNYDAEQEARYALIRDTRGDTVMVPRLKHIRGNAVFFSDLGTDPAKFPNDAYATFWNKHAIGLAADSQIWNRPR